MDEQNQTNQDMNTAPNETAQSEPAVNQESGDIAPTEAKKSLGPVVGAVIVVLVIIVGGLYFWGTQLNKEQGDAEITAEEITAQADPALDALEQQGTSDEIADIEADLTATDLDGLDAELEQIENELNL